MMLVFKKTPCQYNKEYLSCGFSVQVGLEIMLPEVSVDLPGLWQSLVHRPSSSLSLSAMWSLVIFSLASAVHAGEYMTVSRSSAIVNISYYNPATDNIYSEVRLFHNVHHSCHYPRHRLLLQTWFLWSEKVGECKSTKVQKLTKVQKKFLQSDKHLHQFTCLLFKNSYYASYVLIWRLAIFCLLGIPVFSMNKLVRENDSFHPGKSCTWHVQENEFCIVVGTMQKTHTCHNISSSLHFIRSMCIGCRYYFAFGCWLQM